MPFLSPIWLLGLVPWAAVSVYLMSGRRQRVGVPFLALWAGPIALPKAKRAMHRPPWFVLLLMLSMLLAVLAAAEPVASRSGGSGFTIILDRGITMSPVSVSGEPFRGAVALAAGELSTRFDHRPVDFLPVPPLSPLRGEARSTNAVDWAALANGLPPTAMETQAALRQAVAERLRDRMPVVVLTDRKLDLASEQLVQIPPARGIADDVGITAVAARSQPTPQVMVRLRNQSNRQEIQLRIISGQQRVEKTVPLPPAGQTRDYFLDVPGGLAEVVRVEISPHDSAGVNDRAWLAREASWPVVEARTPLPAAVRRMIAVYSKSRPGNSASRQVTVGFDPVPGGQSGVRLQGERSTPNVQHPTSNEGNSPVAMVTAHAVTAHVAGWPGPADPAAVMPSGFKPVVIRAGRVLVAVRDGPAKQVWVNLNWDSWSASPDFVIFFTNVFDWLGNGAGGEYVAHPISRLGEEWKRDSPAPAGVENGLWPGLYRRADGTLRAVNAPEVKWSEPPKMDWREKLARQQTSGAAEIPFAPGLCAAAVIAAMLAAGFWIVETPDPRSRR